MTALTTLLDPAALSLTPADNPTIAFPPCAPYNSDLQFFVNSAAITSATIDPNSSAATVNDHTPATYPQTHIVTNQYGVAYSFQFSASIPTCDFSAEIALLTDGDIPILYDTANTVLASDDNNISISVPPCAPYNLVLSRYEASTLVASTTSANLAAPTVDPASPDTYTETRSLTNDLGFSNQVSFSVIIPTCVEDILITVTDDNNDDIAAYTIALPTSSPVPSFTLPTCAPYNHSIAYRINGDVVNSVNVGDNALQPVTLTPATYPQQYSFSNQFNDPRSADFDVIVPTCAGELRISLQDVNDNELTTATVLSDSLSTVTLPTCAPYLPAFTYAENDILITTAVIAANSATSTVPADRPEGNIEQIHLVTNQYGIVYTFSFTLAPEPCAAALEISLADNFNNSISLGAPVTATPTSSPSFTLPTCAPYTPSFTYTEAYVTLTDITLSPNNLATTTHRPYRSSHLHRIPLRHQ